MGCIGFILRRDGYGQLCMCWPRTHGFRHAEPELYSACYTEHKRHYITTCSIVRWCRDWYSPFRPVCRSANYMQWFFTKLISFLDIRFFAREWLPVICFVQWNINSQPNIRRRNYRWNRYRSSRASRNDTYISSPRCIAPRSSYILCNSTWWSNISLDHVY